MLVLWGKNKNTAIFGNGFYNILQPIYGDLGDGLILFYHMTEVYGLVT